MDDATTNELRRKWAIELYLQHSGLAGCLTAAQVIREARDIVAYVSGGSDVEDATMERGQKGGVPD